MTRNCIEAVLQDKENIPVLLREADGQNILHPGENVRIKAGNKVLGIVHGSRVSADAIFEM